CGGNFTSQVGILRSPDHPTNYSHNLNCVYVISRPEGERITLTFDEFDLQEDDECTFDHLKITDGPTENSPLIGKFCGSTVKDIVRTFGNSMWIQLKTDGSESGKGFSATFTSGVIEQNFLLITNDVFDSFDSLFLIDIDTETDIGVPVVTTAPFAIDYDPVDNQIFWTELGVGEIRKASLNGSGNTLFWASPNRSDATLAGLAVDPLSRLVFYVDAGNDVIGMITITGSVHQAIITSDIDKPRCIALDTMNGVMYWSEVGRLDQVERANYDGTDRRVLVSGNLLVPNGLALDLQNSRLYFVDASTERLESTNLDGGDRQLINSFQNSHFFGLALHKGILYLTDWGPSRHETNASRLYRMKTDGPNGCGNHRGMCSHICIPSPGNSYKCICPEGEVLGSDHKTCGVAGTSASTADNLGAIIGGSVAGAALLIIAVIIVIFIVNQRKRRTSKRQPQQRQEPEASPHNSLGQPVFQRGPLEREFHRARAPTPRSNHGIVVEPHVYDVPVETGVPPPKVCDRPENDGYLHAVPSQEGGHAYFAFRVDSDTVTHSASTTS
ncbi:hypothetical protein BaRGS_00025392, partial [Batillaria attramentaria]